LFSIFAGEKPKTAFAVKVLCGGIGFAYITRRCALMLPLKVWGSFQISSQLFLYIIVWCLQWKQIFIVSRTSGIKLLVPAHTKDFSCPIYKSHQYIHSLMRMKYCSIFDKGYCNAIHETQT